MPTIAAVERATAAQILIAITFHYNTSRLEILCDVLRTLAEFPVLRIRVVLVTNTADSSKLETLMRLGNELFPPTDFSIATFSSLNDPWDLTWCHKSVLAQHWREKAPTFTHFIYLEGDIRLTFLNFCYWTGAREILHQHGLLPSFVRVEYHKTKQDFTASDAFWSIHVPSQAHIEAEDQLFFNMPNPYNPIYILDTDLVAEYMASDSFGMDSSSSVCSWGKPERAAMGLCLEHVPEGFASRYVVPVMSNNRIPAFAWISHLTGNYANSPNSPLGKISMATLVTGAACLGATNPWSEAESLWTRAGGVDLNRLYFLITEHDTVLYFDQAERALKHAPLGIAPLHTCAEICDQQVRLWAEVSVERPQPGDSRLRSVPLHYELRWFADGTIALFADGNFVGADLDGYARHNRARCLQWERYRLIRVDTLAGLSLMRRHRWISNADTTAAFSLADQPVWLRYADRTQPSESSSLAATLAPGTLRYRLGLTFGPACVQLIGYDPVVRIHRDVTISDMLPCTLEVRSRDGLWYGFTRISVAAEDDTLPKDGDRTLSQGD